MKRLFAFTLMLFAAAPSFAADVNGYTSKYERAIGAPPSCSVTIKDAGDPNWNKLNDPAYRVICLQPGDYTSKGIITLTASGTAGEKRWLYSITTSGLHPAKEGAPSAKIRGLAFNNANYWIIHRISIDGNNVSHVPGISLPQYESAGDNNIFDSLLISNIGDAGIWIGRGNDGNVVQNSVIRNFQPAVDQERDCVHLADGPSNTHIVNNEMYDCTKPIYFNEWNAAAGTVIENNDLYMTRATYTDCNGNYNEDGNSLNGVCSTGKTLISMKSGGVSGNPVRITHNRLWGIRLNDTSICCTAQTSGAAINIGPTVSLGSGNANANFVLIDNNVISDSQNGILWVRDDVSNHQVVGNIFYNIKKFSWDPRRATTNLSSAIGKMYGNNAKIYLNSIIDTQEWLFLTSGSTNTDVRCNVVVDGGTRIGGSLASTATVANNAFYGNTQPFTTSSSPAAITGDATQSQTKQFCKYRKLLTGPELFCIPYALPTADSPHARACNVALDLPNI